jgi:hypothetical protein
MSTEIAKGIILAVFSVGAIGLVVCLVIMGMVWFASLFNSRYSSRPRRAVDKTPPITASDVELIQALSDYTGKPNSAVEGFLAGKPEETKLAYANSSELKPLILNARQRQSARNAPRA